jgi:hypothetical protein
MAQESGDLQAGRMECRNQPADLHAGFHFRGIRIHCRETRRPSRPTPTTPRPKPPNVPPQARVLTSRLDLIHLYGEVSVGEVG